jgi:hypothetical protein
VHATNSSLFGAPDGQIQLPKSLWFLPWRRLAALVTIAHAQLVVDWTAKSTFETGAPLKARCAPYTTVTFHRTCLPNANPRSYLKPKDCLPIVRFDEIAADFGLGPSEEKALNNWRRCDLNRSRPVEMHTDVTTLATRVDAEGKARH